jgi:AAA+ superfamily predicted ATPase
MNAPIETSAAASVARLTSWTERNQQWLVGAIARLRARVEAHMAASSAAPTDRPDAVVADAAPGFTPALLRCAQIFNLSPFERELLLLVAGVELDHGLRAAVARLNGGGSPQPSFGLALGMLTQPHWDALSPDAALRYWRFIELEPGVALTHAALRIDERVLNFIAGVAASDARLLGLARYVGTPTSAIDAADAVLLQRIARSLASDDERGPVLIIDGEPRDASALRDTALGAVAYAGRPALWISAHDLAGDAANLAHTARHVDREVALAGAVPVLVQEGAGAETAAVGFIAHLNSVVLWLGPPNAGLASLPEPRRVLHFEAPAPDAARTRKELLARWQRMTGAPGNEEMVAALEQAAAQFHVGRAALEDIVNRLDELPPAERAGAVWSAARAAARGGLNELAQRIVTGACFDDLVLPPAQLAALRDIARQLRHRERVYRDWGFGDTHPRGQGITALFTGESGTGKTLAAEAIANEAELDLYRVDLATLVSKYIGETEKNLKRLFDAAEASGAVLLFDEADALFGKRSEVKDSHDRYANIEVAYLLQRIEAYRGLAILTTNMKSALDRAFLRRIRFIITFPFPDTPAREQIWRRQFAARAPLGDIDFAALARLQLAGGNIRSIAINAAFRAADCNEPIGHEALMAAAHAEFAKLERSINDPTKGGGST